jgi:biopolymer transport protein ExbD
MLDVVFIMLIFFIVVASFIKEAGIEVNRPDNSKSDPSDATSILVNIRADNQIWMENRRVDARSVRANIQRLLASDPEQAVTIKVEKGARANAVVDVADAAREAGAGSVNWASAGGKR